MADQVQMRGGTTAQNDSFTGAAREVTVDTSKNTLRVHDGTTLGGHELATSAASVQKAGDTMTGNLTVPSLNSGQLAGFRNVLINGDFRIIQRLSGYNTPTAVTASQSEFFADRWSMMSKNTGTVQVDSSTTFPYYFYQQSADVSGLRQPVELPAAGVAGPFTVGSFWTLSVWCSRDLTTGDYGNPSLLFVDASGLATNSVIAGTSSWVNTGETTNGFTRYYSTIEITAAPGSTNVALEVVLQGKNSNFNSIVKWAQVQLEPGTVATPFEHRPIGTELVLCQRYYQVIRTGGKTGAPISRPGSGQKILFMNVMPTIPVRDMTQYTVVAPTAFISVNDDTTSANGMAAYSASLSLGIAAKAGVTYDSGSNAANIYGYQFTVKWDCEL